MFQYLIKIYFFYLLEGCFFTWVSTELCHRRSLSATASSREGLLPVMALGSLITEPREPFTSGIRDPRRQERAWGQAHRTVSGLRNTRMDAKHKSHLYDWWGMLSLTDENEIDAWNDVITGNVCRLGMRLKSCTIFQILTTKLGRCAC